MTTPLISPEPPDSLIEEQRTFWREMNKNMIRSTFGPIDEAAKQLIGVTAILEGLYFHAITFSDLRGKALNSWALIFYLAPMVLLLISLSSSLLVFSPKQYPLNIHSSEASQLIYIHVIKRKMLFFKIASIFLALGIVALFFAVLAYLYR